MKTLTIDGHSITDLPSFYREINRVFMADVDWELGRSLDALNDALYGGYGAIDGAEPVKLVWLNMERNRADLGFECTRNWYLDKLKHPGGFDVERIAKDLADLEGGMGPTYFDIGLEIIGDHPNIELVAG